MEEGGGEVILKLQKKVNASRVNRGLHRGGIVLVQRNKLRGKVSAKYTVHLAAQGGGEITHMLRN